tara:strand:- start:8696 stop:9181 length:486 start_codon:yes stop_codon:yes gene_type:complete
MKLYNEKSFVQKKNKQISLNQYNVQQMMYIFQKFGVNIKIYPFNLEKKVKCVIYQSNRIIFKGSLKKKETNNHIDFYTHSKNIIIDMYELLKIVIYDGVKKTYFFMNPSEFIYSEIVNNSYKIRSVYEYKLKNNSGNFCFVIDKNKSTNNFLKVNKFGIYF